MTPAADVAPVTAAVAEWVATVPGEAIPPDVREAARWLILDHLGCAVGGSTLAPGRILLELVREQGGSPQATVFATGERTSLRQAVYLNSALSNLLDFDDSFAGAGHPGGTVISPALNVGEHAGAALGRVVDAVVIGYEVMLRLGLALRPSPARYRVVAGYGAWQAAGAVVAASRLLGLDAERVRHALGLGLVNAPVPNMRKLGLEPAERPFSWSKNNYGWAAEGGVLGALLASRGFLGNRAILDGERGFWLMAGSDRWAPEQATAGLGREWLLPATGVKPYASCRWTHTALDAARRLRERRPDLTANRLGRIRLASFCEVSDNLAAADPTDVVDAQFNVRHLLALELLGRSARLGLREADLTDPAVVALRRRIAVVEESELTADYLERRAMGAVLEVETDADEVLTVRVDDLPGGPASPLPRDELRAKYRALAEPVVGARAARCLEQLVLEAGDEADVRGGLRAALAPGGEG